MITRIREVRRARGMTLDDVAQACSPPTTPQTIGRLETGMRTVSIGWLNRIAEALGVDAADLVEGSGEKSELPVVALLGVNGATAPRRTAVVVAPRPKGGQVAIIVASSNGDYRAGDEIWCETLGPDDYAKALPPAKKAVELMDKPNENWLQLVSALHLQREEYKESIPILQQLIAVAPDKKTYWMQLSSIYGQMEDYPNALAIMQLANSAGLVTEDSEIRRLADLLLFNEVPYRGAQVLESAIEKKAVNLDDKLYEKLANCWIAAREYDKAVPPLQRAAEMANTGDAFIRLGELQVQREDWDGAIAAVQRGVDKGQLKDAASAQLMLGIAHYNQKEYSAARPFFERARQSERLRDTADSYLQAIRAQS